MSSPRQFCPLWLIAPLVLCGVVLQNAALALQSDPPAKLENPAAESRTESAPAGSPRDPQFAKLLAQLGDERYALRERAERELEALGPAVYDDLLSVIRDRDPEVAQRATRTAARLRKTICRGIENERVRESLDIYFETSAAARREYFQRFNLMHSTEVGANVLLWIVALEPDPNLAKFAALQLLNTKLNSVFGARQRNQLIQEVLAKSRRDPAQWLLAIAASANAPEKLLPQWDEYLRREQAEYDRQGQEEQRENIVLMLRYGIRIALENMNGDVAGARLRSLLEIEAQDAQLIPQLLEWIVDEKAWPLIAELERIQPALLETSDIGVIYLLAEAADLQTQPERVKQLLERAAKIQPESGQLHFEMAKLLHRRGRWDWAEAEYQLVLKSKLGTQPAGFLARCLLGHTLQDRERYAEAAEHFAQARKLMRNNENIEDRFDGDERYGSNALQAFEHYNRGLEAKRNNDPAKQLSELQLANQANEQDVNVLIALYQMSTLDKPQRLKISQKVAVLRKHYEEMLEVSPEDPQTHNQYAWLVGNTEGDFDRAIASSLKSVEKRPEAGGFYDTLAHCYFAKRDYDNAVKAQHRAAELDPHTQTIRRALARFEKAQADANEAKGPKQPEDAGPKQPPAKSNDSSESKNAKDNP